MDFGSLNRPYRKRCCYALGPIPAGTLQYADRHSGHCSIYELRLGCSLWLLVPLCHLVFCLG